MTKIKAGHTFGNWTVADDTLVPLKNKSGDWYANGLRVACSCGYERVITLSNLRSGKSTKCRNCYAKKQRKKVANGQRLGKWTVVEPTTVEKEEFQKREIKGRSKDTYVLAQCECGNRKWKRVSFLKQKKSNEGCQDCFRKSHKSGWQTYLKKKGEWIGYEDISASFMRTLQGSAKRRGLECTIDAEYIWRQYLLQEKKCALTDLPIVFGPGGDKKKTTASVDRINSSVGYVEGNVQLVLKDINLMKQSLEVGRFVYLCSLVSSCKGEQNDS